ncbi:hypothetical protein LCGC14_2956560 [marine sediment metagenome]|uniref:Uncharacterized protein n=1 Tax=marine sediment metagenome TaxID=412755 RepID=A0A0F8XEA7_9ZZZZ
MDLDELTDDVWKTRYFRLLKHTAAIRRNQDIVGHVFLSLTEYPPNASAAMEGFDELEHDEQKPLWISTKAGGVWERWQRDAIRYGRLDATDAYTIWERRTLHFEIES